MNATDLEAVAPFVAWTRRAVLATVDPGGRPRLVPICFVLTDPHPEAGRGLVLHSAVDEKPKRATDPLTLARVRDIVARPEVAVLVDRWSEDWDRLAWVRLACRGRVLAADGADTAEHGDAVAALRAKYPQYRDQRLEDRPVIRFECTVTGAWGDLATEQLPAAAPDDVEAM